MSKNPNCKSNDDDDDEDDDDDADDETLRRGCCVKRRTRHVTRVHLGGAWNWTFRAERRYLDPKREHPTMSMVAHHLVHLNSHLEVYIVRHTHRAGKKKVSVSTNSNVSFGGTYGCSNLPLSSHRWVLGKWMSKNPNVKSNADDDVGDDDGDDDETLRRGCCLKRLTRHMARVPFEGGGGGGGSDCRCDVTPAWVVHEPWTGMKLDIHS